MKIGVLASGNLGFEVVKGLTKIHQIEFICTDSNSNSIIEFAESNGIKNYKGNPRNGKAIRVIGDIRVDVLLSINYLFLIEEDLISLPSIIAINIHGSLLPKYRGRTHMFGPSLMEKRWQELPSMKLVRVVMKVKLLSS
ncbi:hypothetical protein BST93_08510 [Nonlabens tegetincola]|nr:hypothetical protein BST93_08510 [Nonlabens tegetincola]